MAHSPNTCQHCNGHCEEEVHYEGHTFCCEGCKTVYSIIHNNSLEKFYELNPDAGKRQDAVQGNFDFLELEEVREQLVLFQEGDVVRVKLKLPQIHCSSCLWLLERLHKIHEGVLSCQVFFTAKEAEINFDDSKISLKELANLLSAIGYKPDIRLDTSEEEQDKKLRRRTILKIGVVGFCFGNIMLLSFPEYVGITELHENFQQTFNYLNVILSLPIIIWGAREYFVSSFKAIRAKTVNIDVPITLGIIALYTRSLYEIFGGFGAGYLDSFAGLIFFLLIGKWFQQITYSSLNFERDYKSYFPIGTSRISEEEEEVITLDKVKVGDRLMIRNNDIIPADAILISGEGRIDYSFVSGESEPVAKRLGDRLYAGGRQVGAALEIEVTKDVENSYLTRLWNNPIFNKTAETSSIVDVVSKYFTLGIIVISVVAAVIWYQIDPSRAPFIVTSVLIVACPCALALSVPFTYGNLLRILAKKDLFLRSSSVIEPLAEVTDVVFDKTGTLTSTRESKIVWQGKNLSEVHKKLIRSLTRHSNHPLSKQLTNHLRGDHFLLNKLEDITGQGLKGEIEGSSIKIGSASFVNGQKVDRSSVHVSIDEEYLGYFEFHNQYRDGVFELMSDLKSDHQIHVLSGDNEAERPTLRAKLGEESSLLFEQQPSDKLDYIKSLQAQGKKVMMLGDGLNDAGALKQADVGIAISEDVHSFTPSSDAILQSEKLQDLLRFKTFAQYGKKVVWVSYFFSLCYNVIGLSFALTGHLTPLVAAILMPLSSISVVLLVTLMTNIRASKWQ